jgi:hypothetical protein
MKDVVEIFVIKEGLLEINKPEVRGIQEFKVILERDRGSEGDSQGRKKLIAYKEFMFIKLYYHPLSIHRDLPDAKRFNKAKNIAKLDKEWEEDEAIKKAGIKYIKLIELSSLFYTYLNARKGVYALGEDIKFFNTLREKHRTNIEELTKQLDVAETEAEKQEKQNRIDLAISSLLSLGTSILKINTSLPSAFNTIEELEQKLLKEGGEKQAIHGGGVVGKREE